MRKLRLLIFSALLFSSVFVVEAQQKVHLDLESPFGSFVEEDFPFFSQTLDARKFGKNPHDSNLTPRGIIVPIGNGVKGCFDPDLLRWSLFWSENEEGEYLTMDGMAPGSYRLPNRKASSGQGSLPRPLGTEIASTAALPGWALSKEGLQDDPRLRDGADEKEIGLGPLPVSLGRFEGLRLTKSGVQIEYRIGSTQIIERVETDDSGVLRHVSVTSPPEDRGTLFLSLPSEEGIRALEVSSALERGKVITVAPGYRISISSTSDAVATPDRFWKESVETTGGPEAGHPSGKGLVFDDLSLPVPNPWERNVRLAGIDFFPDGRAIFCTFDGDVWVVDGIEEGSQGQTWTRFASGLHEPKSVSIVEGAIYVFDRNGIVRLDDEDGNGEADWYANFSNVVPQTAETREFAMDMISDRKGGFFLAKGGQVGSTKGRANGTIAHVAPDGNSYTIVATGLRQPYIGYDPETGILTSSDQQGHWKPATPIYRIEQGKYYGFQPAKLKDKAVHPAPIAPSEIWIPHFINQSGASQVWMKQRDGSPADMGPLNGELIHIGYNRPELFRVYLDENRKQGAVFPLLSGFPSGILKGAIHPVDGRLYLSGFEIWGTSGSRISGLFRVRPEEGENWIPKEVRASRRGVLLSFEQKLSPELASELGRYSVDRWNYRQTHNYGSGNFQLNDEPGQESVPVASATVSRDGKSLFLGIPDMQPSHSLRVTYRVPAPEVTEVESVYLTVLELQPVDLTTRGFESNKVDLSPKELVGNTPENVEPTAKLGKAVALRYGCIACHETGEKDTAQLTGALPADGAAGAQVAVGPAWKGLWKSRRTFTDGSFIKSVDETYLRESILDPGRRVAEGYETEKTGVGMPSYLGVLKDHEIDSILLYIQTLR
ncbi:MAG: hypothetical protein P1U85_06285 [Verrucomicrobiales bacterium]|nr:hypothetical protein [Verrucomicrobiales bacterium]